VILVDGPGYFVELRARPPLGVQAVTSPSSTVVSLSEGEVMVLYTDGLVERRGESLDDGMERLAATPSANSAEAVCRQLTRVMLEDGAQDDVAIVAIRRSEVRAE
jgi:serine phosphatase RsbU (regulator of sigma subunit)